MLLDAMRADFETAQRVEITPEISEHAAWLMEEAARRELTPDELHRQSPELARLPRRIGPSAPSQTLPAELGTERGPSTNPDASP